MRIVVLDGYTLNPGDNPWTPLQQLGDLVVHDRTPENLIVERSLDADILITNKVPLTAETIAKLPRLKFIAVIATGYNNVDTQAAAARKIPVSNVPDYATDSVAQFTFALLLELAHHVGLHDSAVHGGEWERCPDIGFWKTPQIELAGKTFGVVGLGRIGKRAAQLAEAFGMHVLSYSPSKPTNSLEQIFRDSDVVSMHCPLTAANREMVNQSLLSLMKPSAFFLNTSRGPLVREQDLADALNQDKIAGAGVDVVSIEPIRGDNPLLKAKNLIITPHIAWAGVEPRRRVMQTTAANLKAFLAGKPINVVNNL